MIRCTEGAIDSHVSKHYIPLPLLLCILLISVNISCDKIFMFGSGGSGRGRRELWFIINDFSRYYSFYFVFLVCLASREFSFRTYFTLPEDTNFDMNYFVMRKVCTDEYGIKQ